jgi:hypothetical protein
MSPAKLLSYSQRLLRIPLWPWGNLYSWCQKMPGTSNQDFHESS